MAGTFLDRTDIQAAQLIREADLIVQVGVIKTDSNFAAHAELFPRERVVELQHGGTQMPLATVITELTEQLGSIMPTPYARRNALTTSSEPPKSSKLTATTVVQELDRVLSGAEQVVPFISDVGDCLFASLHAKPSLLLAPAFYAVDGVCGAGSHWRASNQWYAARGVSGGRRIFNDRFRTWS